MNKLRRPRTAAPVLIALAALAQMAASPVHAQDMTVQARSLAGGPGASPATVRIDLDGGGAARNLALPRGKSAVIDLPVDVRDILITNPAVADAVLRSPRQIYVLGMTSGQTDAILFDAAGRRILSLNIRVDADTGALADTINRILPGSRVQVEPIGDAVILTGMVASASDADKAAQIAQRYVAKPEQVLNMLSIAGKDQVMLRVRVVEVQRSVIKQLGVNLNAVLQQGSGSITFGQTANFSINGSLPGGVTVGGSYTGPNSPADILNGSIRAFERVGLVRTLAEPNLTAVSGEAAKFLAGGEYPVPVNQDSSNGSVTVEYKPFGVGLAFTPVVLSGGRISLKISTEISELTTQGAFTLGSPSSSTSLTIPALTVRRAETSIELPSGGSMMIAGLIQQTTRENLDALPGVGSVPIIGSLFRSRDFLSGDTEMVVIVTAYVVDPNNPGAFQTPADGLQFASDAETLLFGKLNKTVGAPAGANAGRAYQGPIGYVIE